MGFGTEVLQENVRGPDAAVASSARLHRPAAAQIMYSTVKVESIIVVIFRFITSAVAGLGFTISGGFKPH